jgi:hypothetical protein
MNLNGIKAMGKHDFPSIESSRKEENYERIPFGEVFWDQRSH